MTGIDAMLTIENRTGYEVEDIRFERVFNLFCEEENIDRNKDVNLLFETHENMCELNRRYRGVPRSTDVLSFGFDQPGLPVLGDIVIEIQWADEHRQSRPLQQELEYLFLHGLLHLAGYDHGTAHSRERMDRKHEIIWKKIEE